MLSFCLDFQNCGMFFFGGVGVGLCLFICLFFTMCHLLIGLVCTFSS